MFTFADAIRGAPRPPALPYGFQSWDWQWCYPQGKGWEAGRAALRAAFPKETRDERPAPWFRSHFWTHSGAFVPPGNGPFYIPEWAGPEDGEAFDRWISGLKKAGFRRQRVATSSLPPTREYLIHAMRTIEGRMAWNVDPLLYVVYGYPQGGTKSAKRDLRPFTTGRWTPQGMRPK